jgi:hypothetical protein
MGGAVDLALIQTFVGLYPPVAARARGARCTADSGAWGGRMGKRKSWERNGEKSGGAFLRNFPTIQTMVGKEVQRKGAGCGAAIEEQGAAAVAATPVYYQPQAKNLRGVQELLLGNGSDFCCKQECCV